MRDLLQRCSEKTGYEEAAVEYIITEFLSEITSELSKGNTVDLGEDFGVFSVKLRTDHLTENSPRTPKGSRYKVTFRENNGMKQRLKVSTTKAG